MGKRGRGVVFPKIHSQQWHTVRKDLVGLTLLPQVKGLCWSQTFQTLGPALKGQPPTFGFRKQWGFCPGEPKGCRDPQTLHLKDSRVTSFILTLSIKATFRGAWTTCERGFYLLYLKHLLGDRDKLGLSWGWRCGWVPFLHSSCTSLVQAKMGTQPQ